MNTQNIQLEGLIDEAQRLAERVRDGSKTIDTLNNFGLVIISGVITASLAVGSDRGIIIVIAPLVGFLLLIHAVQTFTELLMMAGHRRFLETYLSQEIGHPFLCHETVTGQIRGKSIDLLLKQFLYAACLLAVGIGAGVALYVRDPAWVFWIYVAFVICSLLTLSYSLFVMFSAEKRSFEAVEEYFKQFRPVQSTALPAKQKP
jgi:hypothetical protein